MLNTIFSACLGMLFMLSLWGVNVNSPESDLGVCSFLLLIFCSVIFILWTLIKMSEWKN